MTSAEWIDVLKSHRAIAVIRSSNPAIAHKMAKSVIQAGMRLIEITWNSGNAAQLIHQLRQDYPDCVIGTGTILTTAQLEDAIAAGTQFTFSPHTNVNLIRICSEHNIPVIPGALSPTEIVTAWQAGASCVKVFPIKTMGGVDYLKCLHGPLGHIPLIPTGGVTIHNALEFLNAGAMAIGLSSHLFPRPLIEKGNWELITERANILVNQLQST